MPSLESQTLPPSAAAAAQSRWWRWPWDAVATLGGFIYWGFAGLLITALSIPLILILPTATAKRLGRGMLHRTFRIFVRYLKATALVQSDLGSLDALKNEQGPVIIAPNHTSLWYAVFVISKLPQPLCIMKESILCNPFLGGGANPLFPALRTGPMAVPRASRKKQIPSSQYFHAASTARLA